MNTASIPSIRNVAELTPSQSRYWNALAKKLAGKVDAIDPWRTPLKNLRKFYEAGTTVYRASTGGKWGKSAQIAKL